MSNSYCSANKEDINSFLLQFKTLLEKGSEFIPRTYDGITNLGLDIQLAEDELYELTYHNYDRGPNYDKNGDGTMVWEFGLMIDEDLTYIKIKIQNNTCKILSFKKSKGPFTLPYKNW